MVEFSIFYISGKNDITYHTLQLEENDFCSILLQLLKLQSVKNDNFLCINSKCACTCSNHKYSYVHIKSLTCLVSLIKNQILNALVSKGIKIPCTSFHKKSIYTEQLIPYYQQP